MSDPTAAAIDTRTDVLPDYTMSEPEFTAHVAVEQVLNRDYQAEYVAVAVQVDPSRFSEAMEVAGKYLEGRPFAAMSDGYYQRVALRKDVITPHLVKACLKRDHPSVALSTVEAMIKGDRFFAAQVAAFELFGFVAKKATGGGSTEAGEQGSPSTSPPFTEPSASGG